MMDENQRSLLKSNLERILLDLDAEDILSYLSSTTVFSEDELLKLSSMPNKSTDINVTSEKIRMKKTEYLMNIILSNDRKYSFFCFYDALRYGEYHHLADVLISGVVRNFRGWAYNEKKLKYKSVLLPRIETVLKNGGVPDLPRVFVNRPTCLEQLGSALQELKDNAGSIIVHGMTGCGKTIMAIKILHDENLVHSCFPDGVFWLSLGDVNETTLLRKLKNLCSLITKEDQKPSFATLNNACNYLKILFTENSHSLLILDDAYSGIGLKCLNIHTRILLTTTNYLIADQMNLFNKIKVPVPKSFSFKQCKQVVSKWMNCQVSELPNEAHHIMKEYQCYPLAIAMIGALMRSSKSNLSFSSLSEKENTSKETITNPLYSAIATSLHRVPEKLRKKYRRLVIFEEDVGISLIVLSKYWQLGIVETRIIMDELIERSLIIKKNSLSDLYFLYKIQLGFLKNNLSYKQIIKYHDTLVEVYFKQCNGNLSDLEDDSYIHWYLILHLISAKRISTAFDLMTNFCWLQKSLRCTNTSSVIKCFNDVEEVIKNDSGFPIVLLQNCRKFICSNSYLLAADSSIDIIQLAIANPTSLTVYNLALNCATVKSRKSNKNNLYFGKKNDITITNEMQVDCKLQAGHYCKFSNDGKLMALCGDDEIVRIQNRDTLQELLIYKGHTDVVNHCEFSPDDVYVISCSDDCTVRLWSRHVTKEIFCLESHKEGVKCCRFAPNGEFVVSASLDGTVKVWNVATGSLLYTIEKHGDVVNWCCVSSDSTLVASCSNDLTIHVWSVEEQMTVLSIRSDRDFVSCCSFVNEGLLGSSLNCISLYSLIDGQELWSINAISHILFFAVSPDQKYLASSHIDLSVKLYDMGKRLVVRHFVHSYPFSRIDFCPDGKSIATSSHQGFCEIWNVDVCDSETSSLANDFNAVYIENDQFVALSVTNSNNVKRLVSDGDIFTSKKFESKISCCVLNGDAKSFALGFDKGAIDVLETFSMTVLNRLSRHTGTITNLCFHGNNLLSSSTDKSIVVWCLNKNVATCVFGGHTEMLTSCFFMHEGSKVVSSSYDGQMSIWDVQCCALIVACPHDQSAVLSCAASNRGDRLLTGTADSTIRLWDSRSGEVLWSDDKHHFDAIRCVVFSNDDDLFATGSDDGIVRIWSAKNFDLHCELKTNDGWVRDIKFSVQNSMILVLTDVVRWFNVHDRRILQTFLINGCRQESVFCTRGFDKFITMDSVGRVHVMERLV